MILHLPHAATAIPERFLDAFVLPPGELRREVVRMTDWHTDELFRAPGAAVVRFPWSRLVVDVERFRDDGEEPMAAVGMAKFYTRTADGAPLRREPGGDERAALLALYDAHHAALGEAVSREVAARGSALIVDAHSFPSRPLPCDRCQAPVRPDVCIGTDPFHTDPAHVEAAAGFLRGEGLSVGVDSPYAGTIVPMSLHGRDRRVRSLMIEVNRALYLDEATGRRGPRFDEISGWVATLLGRLQSLE